MTINIRLIKKNDQILLRELIKLDLDIIVVTETWLKDDATDLTWVKGCDFNKPPYQCYHANRHAKTGGGLMLICKSTMEVMDIQAENTRSFEHASCSVSINNKSITAIYHPPPKAGITNAMFVDDITEHLSDLLTVKQNNIIIGDFNMHVDDPFDQEACIFNDTMLAFGLAQHVSLLTHNRGNTLDLMFTEVNDAIHFGNVQTGPMLSDHAFVHGELDSKKPKTLRHKIIIRKFSAITDEMLLDEFNDDLPFDDQDLYILITKLDDELKRVIDTLAPPKEVTLSTHQRQPWVDDTVKSHRVVRNRECVWLKYKLDSNWKA